MARYEPIHISGGIGTLVRAVVHPCATGGPELWVTCALPAALKALYGLIPIDVKHNMHALTERSWIKNMQLLGEDGVISEAVFNSEGIRFLFKFAALADAAAYWLFVADILIDFLANWTSLVWEKSGCTPDPRHGFFYAHEPFGAFTDNDTWSPLAAWHETAPSPGAIDGSVIILPPNSTGSMGAAVKPAPIFGGQIPFAVRIRDATAQQVLGQTGFSGSDIFGSNAAIVEVPFSTTNVPHTLVAEVLCPTVHDGHPHVVGFNGGSLSASWKSKDT